MEEDTIIKIDYGNLLIRCRVCLSTDHMVKDCPERYVKLHEANPMTGEGDSDSSKDGGTTPAGGSNSRRSVTVPAPVAGDTLPSPPPLALGQIPYKLQPFVSSAGRGRQHKVEAASGRKRSKGPIATESVQGSDGVVRSNKEPYDLQEKMVGDSRSRAIPPFEWNGWEFVQRGPKYSPGKKNGYRAPLLEVRPDTPSIVVLETKLNGSSEVSSGRNSSPVVVNKNSKSVSGRSQSRGYAQRPVNRRLESEQLAGISQPHVHAQPSTQLQEDLNVWQNGGSMYLQFGVAAATVGLHLCERFVAYPW